MKSVLIIIVSISHIFFIPKANAQVSKPDTLHATRLTTKINFDGYLNEAIWKTAEYIDNFTEQELDFGKPATDETKVAIFYDNLALYIGVWCYQSPDKIIAKFLNRDFDYDTEDNFEVILSPFNDNRNGYLFIINPNGARADLLVSGQGSSNMDWNGVWDAKTSITNEGWFAEIRIPFNTLQFKNESLHTWAINFERNIRYKNEVVLWQGWNRNYDLENLSQAGMVTGIVDIGYAKHFELKPYGLSSFEREQGHKTDYVAKAGGDLNMNLSATMKLNLTANTDFAQVESDRIAVNLTRFNLFYPEKREFFLDGYQNYEFNLGGNNEAFYTRKIGIENFEPVSIIGGGRLFGKVGKNNIGLLNIQTASQRNVPSTNNSVLRYKRDIGNQSYIGAILTSKNSSLVSNQIAGVDGAYSTSKFLKNKNLVIGGLISKSFDKGHNSNNAYAWNVFADFPNDLIDNFIGIRSIQQDYNPELGFLERKNFDNYRWHLNYSPRWFTKYGIRKMLFQAWGFELYRTHTTGQLETFTNETRPFGFFTKSGEQFGYNLLTEFERLDSVFNLTNVVKIPSGKYWMYRQDIQAGTFQGRKFWINADYSWGGFYTGRIHILECSLGINMTKHLNFRTDYTLNEVMLPEGNVTTNELAQYINYAFTTRLDISSFIQWNSLDDLLSGNFRLHWIPNIGSDLYVVYNRGYDKLKYLDFKRPDISSGAAKLVWRFTF